MFYSKKRRAAEEARQSLNLGREKEELSLELDTCLKIDDPAERYIALCAFKTTLEEKRSARLRQAAIEKDETQFWASIGAASPIPLIWIATEPFTGTIHLLATVVTGLVPSIIFKETLIKYTSVGDGAFKEARPDLDLIQGFEKHTQDCLSVIERDHIRALATSPRLTELQGLNPGLAATMLKSFTDAAARKAPEAEKSKPAPRRDFEL